MKAIGKELENPKRIDETMVHVSAMRIMGLRPTLSDARPQEMPTNACDKEKTSASMPAYEATFFVGTWKDFIISGMYG